MGKYQLGQNGEAYIDFFHTTYFDSTLDYFNKSEVDEYTLMFIDYMKSLWGDDIDVEINNRNVNQIFLPKDDKSDDKYFIRIKKRP